MASRSRSWCWTLNNYGEADVAGVDALQMAASYTVYGKEVGESGTPHLQGYSYFAQPKSLKQLKEWLPRAHLEISRGTPEEAANYCKKDGDFQEFGEPPMTKKRKGECGKEFWDDVLSKAKAGRIDEIDSKVQVTHYRTLKAIKSDFAPMPADNEEIVNFWYWGPTGTGKSRTARDQFPGAYLKMCNKWWDGYNGEEVALIEDFDKSHAVLGHHLKIWSDRYSFRSEIKNHVAVLRPKTIVVTSNWSPDEIWSDPQTLGPIRRRFKVVHFPELGDGLSP